MAGKSNIIFTKQDRDLFRKTPVYRDAEVSLSWLIFKMELFKCFSAVLFFFGRKQRKAILRETNALINKADRQLRSIKRFPEKLFLTPLANEKEKANANQKTN